MARGHRSLIAVGIGVLIAAGITSYGPSAVRAVAAADPITFGTPAVADPLHAWGEPDIAVNPKDGSVYTSGPTGTGTQRSAWVASLDGGQTFQIVGQCATAPGQVGLPTQVPAPCPPPTGVASDPNATSSPGGGDTDIRFDHTGKQYFADLYALACQRVATTIDDGATAQQNVLGCGNVPPTCSSSAQAPPCPEEGSDRQWLAVVDPALAGLTTNTSAYAAAGGKFPLTYMEYNNLNTVQSNCSTWVMSTDGLTYTSANNAGTGNYGCDGYPSVDQQTGVVLEASSCSTGTPATNSVCLNIGEPDGTGFLHFLDDPASTAWPLGGNDYGHSLITVASGMPSDTAVLFVTSSMDSGRNLHVAFGVDGPTVAGSVSSTAAPDKTGEWSIFSTVAAANASPALAWRSFANPVQVSIAPAAENIMPWIVAGGPGRSDIAWYGTSDRAVGPSATDTPPQTWNVYMSQVVWPTSGGAVTLADPAVNGGAVTPNPAATSGVSVASTVTTVPPALVSPHPMQFGGICLLGTGCATTFGNRNIADFFVVSTDKNGAAVISYDDTSNQLLQGQTQFGCPAAGTPPCPPQAADHAGAPLVTIGRQTSGPGLLGGDVPTNAQYQPSAPTTGMADSAGDARYPVISGPNQKAFDLLSNQLSLSADNSTLTVTLNAADLSSAAVQGAATTVTGTTLLQYVTRWQIGKTLYYAMAETDPVTHVVNYYAGTAQSVDLCSVSACFPHDIVYPETGTGANTVTGTVTGNTISIQVPAGDVGAPTQTSLLEEVGSYALAAARPQSAITNAQGQADQVPLEIDGICCFNYAASPATNVPETPWTPALLGLGIALVAVGLVRRRRTSAAVVPGADGT